MDILLERYTLPKKGVFEIDLHQAIDIRVTAEEAQHQVNRWLLENVSYMMYADPPTLVIGERAVWRVPAVFTSSQVGRVGIVGHIDVNIQSGYMDNTPERQEQLIQRAREMAAKLPPYQPGSKKALDEFIPKHVPRAKIAQLPTDEDE